MLYWWSVPAVMSEEAFRRQVVESMCPREEGMTDEEYDPLIVHILRYFDFSKYRGAPEAEATRALRSKAQAYVERLLVSGHDGETEESSEDKLLPDEVAPWILECRSDGSELSDELLEAIIQVTFSILEGSSEDSDN